MVAFIFFSFAAGKETEIPSYAYITDWSQMNRLRFIIGYCTHGRSIHNAQSHTIWRGVHKSKAHANHLCAMQYNNIDRKARKMKKKYTHTLTIYSYIRFESKTFEIVSISTQDPWIYRAIQCGVCVVVRGLLFIHADEPYINHAIFIMWCLIYECALWSSSNGG